MSNQEPTEAIDRRTKTQWSEAGFRVRKGQTPDSLDEVKVSIGRGRSKWVHRHWYRADQVEPKNQRRVEASKAAATKRAEQLLAYVRGLVIEVPDMQDDQLLRGAIENYNALHCESGKYASAADSPEFLERIQVNYLRHCCTRYELELERIHGHVGVDDARMELRRRIYDAIGEQYPLLSCECDEQMERRFAEELWAL